MKEINEKDMEKATGGATDIRSGGKECDKYEPKYEMYREMPEYQNCFSCSHHERVGSEDVCNAGVPLRLW